MPIRERDGDVVTAHIVRIGQDLTLTQHNTGSDAPPLPDADHRIADLLGHALDLFLDSIKCCHCLAPLSLLVTCKLLLCRYVSMRCRYGLSMSEQESTVPEAAPSPPGQRLHPCCGPETLPLAPALASRPS